MGVINAENLMAFRSSDELFARINKFAESFSSQNMIDETDFYLYIVEILEKLGVSVYRECEALIKIKNFRGKLPCNFKYWYAGYKCHRGEYGFVPSINEQRPWIYYQDNEISQVCPDNAGNCCIDCQPGNEGKTKIIIRTFVNGDSHEDNFHNPSPLFLSPNVKSKAAPHCMKQIRTHMNEVTIDDQHWLHTKFEHDHVYLQYYGLPYDDDFLPMIPDVTQIEEAIEYYIYKKLLQKWYLNDTVPNVIQKLQYFDIEYKNAFANALYYVKLPTFQRTIQSIRTMRSKGKYFNFAFDRTRVGASYAGLSFFPTIPIF